MVMDIVISVVLLVVGIATLVVIHVCVVGRLFRVGDPNGALVHRFSTTQNSRVLSIEDINRLPCFDYYAGGSSTGSSNGGGGVECAVCLETFKVGEKCRLLPNCGHSFHVQCIDSWLLKTPVCPICRTCVDDDASGGGKGNLVEGSSVNVHSNLGDVILELT